MRRRRRFACRWLDTSRFRDRTDEHRLDAEHHLDAEHQGRSQLTIVPGSGHYLDFDFAAVNETLTAFLDTTIGTRSGI